MRSSATSEGALLLACGLSCWDAARVSDSSTDDIIWVGLINVLEIPGSGALDGAYGAFVHVASRAPSLSEAVRLVEQRAADYDVTVRSFDWFVPEHDLSDAQKTNEMLADLRAVATDDGDAFSDTFYCYPEVDEPSHLDDLKEEAEGFVESWLEGAVDNHGETFDLGDFAFIAELRFRESVADSADVGIGWAFRGDRENAASLFERAAAVARENDQPE
jgi:hypothetical protein